MPSILNGFEYANSESGEPEVATKGTTSEYVPFLREPEAKRGTTPGSAHLPEVPTLITVEARISY